MVYLKGQRAMMRDEFVNSSVDREMFGLEVGPGYAPTFRRKDGWNIETLDHASADGLRKKYTDLGIDISQIEEVDYISDGRALHEMVPRRGEYDFIFASHVIEHLTDPLGFMQSCDMLLKPSGKLVFIVPDKRRCFDAFQQLSTTGDFIDACNNKATRHTPGRAFDFMAGTVSLNGSGIWEDGWTGQFSLSNSLEQAKKVFNDVSAAGAPYIDIHAWRFVPSSLRLIIQELNAIGILKLREASFYPAHNFEFYIALSAIGAGADLSNIDLRREIMKEQVTSFNQILGAA
jgi:SAM-dependent methyltransferase